jgi:DNA-binding response OmpR family regulator
MTGDSSDELEPVGPDAPRAVLCVDDDGAVLSSLRRTLRAEPYDVLTAPNAAQALASLRKRAIDVVITDEHMPEVRGSEFLAEVRERWPLVGRVILTGYPGHSVMMRGFRVGVDFLIHKPWDDGALRKTIRKLIRKVERSRRGGRSAADPGRRGG